MTTNNNPSIPAQFTEREFIIDGKKVRAFFPQKPDEEAMSFIKNVLLTSHVKNAGNH